MILSDFPSETRIQAVQQKNSHQPIALSRPSTRQQERHALTYPTQAQSIHIVDTDGIRLMEWSQIQPVLRIGDEKLTNPCDQQSERKAVIYSWLSFESRTNQTVSQMRNVKNESDWRLVIPEQAFVSFIFVKKWNSAWSTNSIKLK